MYIQSRWYRAPEVLLGLPATSAIDMWSAGCVLVELFAGVPPFRGNDSFDQMKMITDAVGMPSDKMRKRCARETLEKLDEIGEEINERWSAADTRYPEYKDESVESRLTRRLLSFRHSLGAHNEDTNEENAQLTHLICQILVVDPLSRITAAQALEHPFFLGSSASKYASSPTASTSAKLATLGASTPVKAVTFDATHKSPEKALSKTLPLPRTSANGVNMSIVSSPKAATTLSRSHSNESDARQPGDKVIGKRSAEKGIPRAASTAIFRAAASSSGGTSSEQSLNSSLNASLDLGGTPIPKAKQVYNSTLDSLFDFARTPPKAKKQPFALEIQASPKAKAGDKKTFDRTEAMQSTTTPRWRREG
ncbi:kinase-like domain-containing protein [Baffinella frigidus]|nr:kinase-like domain-containing protein [Cryptophyta sp. CCMP2293]